MPANGIGDPAGRSLTLLMTLDGLWASAGALCAGYSLTHLDAGALYSFLLLVGLLALLVFLPLVVIVKKRLSFGRVLRLFMGVLQVVAGVGGAVLAGRLPIAVPAFVVAACLGLSGAYAVWILRRKDVGALFAGGEATSQE